MQLIVGYGSRGGRRSTRKGGVYDRNGSLLG
jgi:hypothetical protein